MKLINRNVGDVLLETGGPVIGLNRLGPTPTEDFLTVTVNGTGGVAIFTNQTVGLRSEAAEMNPSGYRLMPDSNGWVNESGNITQADGEYRFALTPTVGRNYIRLVVTEQGTGVAHIGTTYTRGDETAQATLDFEYEIILLMGEANMIGVDQSLGVGNTYTPDPQLDAGSARIFQWSPDGNGDGGSANTLLAAIDPLLFPVDLVSAERNAEYTVSPGMEYCRRLLLTAHPSKKFVLVPAAVRDTGFTGTDNWLPPSGSLYTQAVTAAAAARTALADSKISTVLWVQGEFDADVGGTSVTQYKTRLLSLISALRSDLSEPDLKFISGGVVPEYRDNDPGSNTSFADFYAVDQAHKEYVLDTDNAVHVPGNHGYATSGDEIFYTVIGQRDHGRTMAKYANLADRLTTTIPTSPTRVTANANNVSLNFTVSVLGAQKYLVETRQAGSNNAWDSYDFFPDQAATPGDIIQYAVPEAFVEEKDVRITAIARAGSSSPSPVVTMGIDNPLDDTYYDHVVLLAPYAGVDRALTATDYSSGTKTITFSNSALIDITRSELGAGSLRLNGFDAYASVADSDDFNLHPTTDARFTIEGWFRADDWTTGAVRYLISQFSVSTPNNHRSWALTINASNELAFSYSNDGTAVTTPLTYSLASLTDGMFYHFCVDYDGTTARLYVDGAVVDSDNSAMAAFFNSTATFRVGSIGGTAGSYFRGNVEWVRLTKGTARYAGAFTVPSLPLALDGPAMPTPHPNWNNVVFQSEFTGVDAATTADDVSTIGATLTFNGDAQLDTDRPIVGTSSLLLDGTGDYVSAPDNTSYEFGSGDFQIELKVRWDNAPTSSANGQGLIAKYATTSNQREWALVWGHNSTATLKFFVSTSGSTDIERLSVAFTPVADTDYHLAVSKTSDVYRMFINGEHVATVTQSETLFAGTAPLQLGTYNTTNYLGATGGPVWIDSVRISKGASSYTGRFNPPTGSLPTN